jgi:hypothetical protein
LHMSLDSSRDPEAAPALPLFQSILLWIVLGYGQMHWTSVRLCPTLSCVSSFFRTAQFFFAPCTSRYKLRRHGISWASHWQLWT